MELEELQPGQTWYPCTVQALSGGTMAYGTEEWTEKMALRAALGRDVKWEKTPGSVEDIAVGDHLWVLFVDEEGKRPCCPHNNAARLHNPASCHRA